MDGETPRGATGEVICVGGSLPPPEENADLPDFTPECVHLLLREVYGDFPHHNYGLHLDGGVGDDALWQRRWLRLAAQSANWYATPTGAVGRRFTAILDVEWWGVIYWSWNSKIPLGFAHIVLRKTLSIHRDREIRARITRRMDLWERGIHAGLVGDSKAEVAARDGRSLSGREDEEETKSRSYHDTVLSSKL